MLEFLLEEFKAVLRDVGVARRLDDSVQTLEHRIGGDRDRRRNVFGRALAHLRTRLVEDVVGRRFDHEHRDGTLTFLPFVAGVLVDLLLRRHFVVMVGKNRLALHRDVAVRREAPAEVVKRHGGGLIVRDDADRAAELELGRPDRAGGLVVADLVGDARQLVEEPHGGVRRKPLEFHENAAVAHRGLR